MTFDPEAAATATYPHEHVGYSQPAPPNCYCDECYVNDQRRLAFVAGAIAALESGDSEPGGSDLDRFS